MTCSVESVPVVSKEAIVSSAIGRRLAGRTVGLRLTTRWRALLPVRLLLTIRLSSLLGSSLGVQSRSTCQSSAE